MLLNRRLLSAAAVALTCAVTAAAYYYKSRQINEVMVFCKLQFNAYNTFDKLMSYVEAAKECVNVCMPSIHNPAVQGRLVKLLNTKNIKVRIIIDQSGYNESTDFFLKELIAAGAEIKYKNSEQFYMQHKFCIMDNKVLMTGTLNWGNDRSFDHWNYVYVTSKTQLVDPVKKEFYQMWDEYSSKLEVCNEYLSCDSDTEIGEVRKPGPSEFESPGLVPHTLREKLVTPEVCIV